MSYLLVVQMSAVLLPLIAFLPEIWAAVRKHSSTLLKVSGLKSAGLHLVFSILLMLVLQQGYRQINGRLAGREPAYLVHGEGEAEVRARGALSRGGDGIRSEAGRRDGSGSLCD